MCVCVCVGGGGGGGGGGRFKVRPYHSPLATTIQGEGEEGGGGVGQALGIA